MQPRVIQPSPTADTLAAIHSQIARWTLAARISSHAPAKASWSGCNEVIVITRLPQPIFLSWMLGAGTVNIWLCVRWYAQARDRAAGRASPDTQNCQTGPNPAIRSTRPSPRPDFSGVERTVREALYRSSVHSDASRIVYQSESGRLRARGPGKSPATTYVAWFGGCRFFKGSDYQLSYRRQC